MHQAPVHHRSVPGLGWAIAGSLLVHGLVLLGGRPEHPDIVIGSQTLSVQVIAANAPASAPAAIETLTAVPDPLLPAPVRRSEPKQPVVRQAVTRPARTSPAQPAERTDFVMQTAGTPARQTPPEAAAKIGETRTEHSESETRSPSNVSLLASLREALSQHFTYPVLARRRGWEGEVVLGFVLRPNGSIEDVEVTRSSGFGLLDRSARSALRKVQRVPLSGMHLVAARNLELPVQYRLKDN